MTHFPELCLEAVKATGYAIKFVKHKILEICLAAVRYEGALLRYIPDTEQTLPLVIAALQQNPDCRDYIAVKFRKPEVYKAAGYDYKPEDLAPSHGCTKQERTEPEI